MKTTLTTLIDDNIAFGIIDNCIYDKFVQFKLNYKRIIHDKIKRYSISFIELEKECDIMSYALLANRPIDFEAFVLDVKDEYLKRKRLDRILAIPYDITKERRKDRCLTFFQQVANWWKRFIGQL